MDDYIMYPLFLWGPTNMGGGALNVPATTIPGVLGCPEEEEREGRGHLNGPKEWIL